MSLLGTAGQTVCFCGRIGTACVDLRNSIQLTFDRFYAACHQKGTKMSSKNIEVLCTFPRQCFLGRRPRQCFLQVSTNTLQQVETFKYLGVVFTCDESRNKGNDTRIGKANAVLRELYCSVVTKQGLSNNANFSVFKSLFVPILICDHEP